MEKLLGEGGMTVIEREMRKEEHSERNQRAWPVIWREGVGGKTMCH